MECIKYVLIVIVLGFFSVDLNAQSQRVVDSCSSIGSWTDYGEMNKAGESNCGSPNCQTVDEGYNLSGSVGVTILFLQANFSISPPSGSVSVCALSQGCDREIAYWYYTQTHTKFHEEYHNEYYCDTPGGLICEDAKKYTDFVYTEKSVSSTQAQVHFCPDKPSTWPTPCCCQEGPKNPDACEDIAPCRHEDDGNPKNGAEGDCPYPMHVTPTSPDTLGVEPECPYSHSA